MFLARYDKNGESEFYIYNKNQKGYKGFFEDIVNAEDIEVLDLKVKGNNYKEKQDYLRDLAIDYQTRFGALSWSYGELMEICNFFATNGQKYGLLKEFKENAIC